MRSPPMIPWRGCSVWAGGLPVLVRPAPRYVFRNGARHGLDVSPSHPRRFFTANCAAYAPQLRDERRIQFGLACQIVQAAPLLRRALARELLRSELPEFVGLIGLHTRMSRPNAKSNIRVAGRGRRSPAP